MLIALYIYLWLCSTVASLMAVTMMRPVFLRDVIIAFLFPILFPAFTLARVVRGG